MGRAGEGKLCHEASTQLVVYGHPMACAAAVANLEIWRSELVAERIVALTQAQVERLTTPQQSGVREIGTIAALDLVVEDAGYLAGI